MSGNIRPQLSKLTGPLWTDPGLKSLISVHELVSTSKKKKMQAENEWLNILSESLQAGKKPPAQVLPPGRAEFADTFSVEQYVVRL